MTLSAVIPTIGAAPDLLFALIGVLVEDNVPAVVYDNGAPADVRHWLDREPVEVRDAAGMGLYAMWDDGVTRAEADYVAVLNDDITILPGTLWHLADALATDPTLDLVSADYTRRTADGIGRPDVWHTRGTYKDGGACGWCFVVRRDTYPAVGPGYDWWCGDDELVARIHAAGRTTGIVRGVPVDHAGEASAATQLWTESAKHRDLATFVARWS